jgi:hypothetical protein
LHKTALDDNDFICTCLNYISRKYYSQNILFVPYTYVYLYFLYFDFNVCLFGVFCLFVIFSYFILVFKDSKASTEMGNYPSTSTITRDPMYINVTESNLSEIPSTESSLSELPSDHVYERLRRWRVWVPNWPIMV